jgi:hypothetical protein
VKTSGVLAMGLSTRRFFCVLGYSVNNFCKTAITRWHKKRYINIQKPTPGQVFQGAMVETQEALGRWNRQIGF